MIRGFDYDAGEIEIPCGFMRVNDGYLIRLVLPTWLSEEIAESTFKVEVTNCVGRPTNKVQLREVKKS